MLGTGQFHDFFGQIHIGPGHHPFIVRDRIVRIVNDDMRRVDRDVFRPDTAALHGFLVDPHRFINGLHVECTLIRGPIADWYPYPFLDPGVDGAGSVVAHSAGILIVMVVVSYTTLAVGDALRKRR